MAKKRTGGRILSVIGTDTEIGKTVLAAALARDLARRGLRVGVFKPFACDPATRATGEGFSTDADLLARAAGMGGGAADACGQHFSAPLSPLAAARLEGRRVDIGAAVRRAREIAADADVTIVEGCGGWEVPLTEGKTTAEFFVRLGAPALIIARAGLGTINHSLLTLRAVRADGLPVVGIVLNRCQAGGGDPAERDPSERDNPAILRKFARVPVWGPVGHVGALAGKAGDRVEVEDLPPLGEIAGEVLRGMGRVE